MKKGVGIAVLTGTLFGLVGSAMALATTQGPTVYEQQSHSGVSLPVNPTTLTLTTSPVLPTGTYLVNAVVTVGIINPGTGATCGVRSTAASGDVVAADTGQLGNGNAAGSFIDGNCVVTGTVQLKSANDHIQLYAAASNGPGAVLDNSAIVETPIGRVILSIH
jgi:hypothetical protein